MTTYHPQHPGLIRLLARSPWIEDKQWAIHSTGCLWWTTFPQDCGQAETGLGCCPYCQASLQQEPLLEFLHAAEKMAEKKTNNYGPTGLAVFILAHHHSRYPTCRKFWPRYNIPIKITHHASRITTSRLPINPLQHLP